MSVAVPDPVMDVELSDAVSPGEETVDRLTVPVNPFSPVMVRVAVPGWPALKPTPVGLAARLKSTTLIVTKTE